jgi:hypothetical protein
VSKDAAIVTANAILTSAGLPGYDELANLLRAANTKLTGMVSYHSGPSAQALEALSGKLRDALDKLPS